MDESTDIKRTRINNVTLASPHGSLFIISKDIDTLQMTSDNIAATLKKHMLDVSNGNLT